MNGIEVSARLLAGIGLILANAFFVAVEFGLTRARQYDRSEFDEPGLRRAWEMTDDLEIYLTSCQVAISGTSIAVGIVAEPALSALFSPLFATTPLAGAGAGAVLGFVLINVVHMTHGEQTPTYLGVERSKQVCRYGAEPLYWFTKLILPFIAVGDSVAKATLRLFGVEMTGAWLEAETDRIESRGDLRHALSDALERGERSGALTSEEREEVLNAFEVGGRPVEEIMVPREEVVALSTEADPEATIERISDHPHVRFPVVGEDLEDFRGVLYVPALTATERDFEGGEVDLAELAAPPLTVDADTSVTDFVDRLQAENQELALVTRDGSIVGLVTDTDAFEAVLGDLEDPLDEGEIPLE